MNNEEVLLLATIINDVTTYTPIRRFVSKDVISHECDILLGLIKSYSKEIGVTSNVPTGNLLSWATVNNKIKTNKFDRVKAKSLLAEAALAGIKDEKTVQSTLKHFIRLKYALDIHNASQDFILGNTDFDKMEKAVSRFTDSISDFKNAETIEFVTTDIKALSETTVGSSGLNWRLDCLNLSLGPLRQGDLVIIGARPEVGKTTLVASEASYMATQLQKDQQVLWVCNEEAGNRIQFRVYQAALGWTKTKMLLDISKTEDKLNKVLGNKDRIRVLHNPYISIEQVEQACEKVNPGLIIIDQLDKVTGVSADRPDLVLKSLYQRARVLANKYGPVLAVSQCDSSAEGQRWLHQGQLDGSKTSKPGEADAIILIGKDNDEKHEFDRYISIPKNKLAGGPKSDERARHGKFEVQIKPETARYL